MKEKEKEKEEKEKEKYIEIETKVHENIARFKKDGLEALKQMNEPQIALVLYKSDCFHLLSDSEYDTIKNYVKNVYK